MRTPQLLVDLQYNFRDLVAFWLNNVEHTFQNKILYAKLYASLCSIQTFKQTLVQLSILLFGSASTRTGFELGSKKSYPDHPITGIIFTVFTS